MQGQFFLGHAHSKITINIANSITSGDPNYKKKASSSASFAKTAGYFHKVLNLFECM